MLFIDSIGDGTQHAKCWANGNSNTKSYTQKNFGKRSPHECIGNRKRSRLARSFGPT